MSSSLPPVRLWIGFQAMTGDGGGAWTKGDASAGKDGSNVWTFKGAGLGRPSSWYDRAGIWGEEWAASLAVGRCPK
jgi:hypothetical protein